MPSDVRRLAEAMGEDYQAPHERLQPSFRREGDAYVIGFPSAGISVEATGVETARSETHALIRVTSTNPGTPPLLHHGRFNITSSSARTSLVRYLNARCELADWSEVVEQVCFRVLDAIREGQPPVLLTNVQPRIGARFRVAPMLVEGFPNIIFGPGGSAKSLLAALVAIGMHGGWNLCDMDFVPGPVMVCDWELDDVTYREVVEKLCRGFGIEMPPIHYRQCAFPLAEEASAIGRYAAREGIELIVVDSLGFAIGGDKTSQELTMRMFSAMRTWRKTDGGQITVLGVDHITNDETQGNRPYGSVYTQNAARSLWRVRAQQDDGSNEMSVGLMQTKANFGKQAPVGFHIRFDEDATYVTREDVREMDAMREHLPASMRIKTAIAESGGGLTKDEIVERTGLRESIVKARLSDLKRRGDLTPQMAAGGAAVWFITSRREEPPA